MAEALLPFLPKFRHALLDLTQCDPAREEDRGDVKVVLQLMKYAREQRLMEFFVWLATEYAGLRAFVSDPLLRRIFTYSFDTDQTLDVEAIYLHFQSEPRLKNTFMTTAETLIAKGEAKGQAFGLVMGKLQMLEQLMGGPVTPQDALQGLSLEELEERYRDCQARYDSQFKRPS